MTRWLVMFALAACSKPKADGPAPVAAASPCPRVADHLVSLMSGAGKHPPELTDPLRRAIDKRCTSDGWSTDATRCLLDLTSLADGERCQAMMTPAQVDAFQRDSEAATVELRDQLTENPPSDGGSFTRADAAASLENP